MKNMFWVIAKEFKNFVRDSHTIIYSIVFPILLYPLIFWGMNQIMTLRAGTLEQTPSRIAFAGHIIDEIVLLILQDNEHENFTLGTEILTFPPENSEQLRDQDLDAVIFPKTCGKYNQVFLVYDSASDRSIEAKQRIEKILQDYRIQHVVDMDLSGEDATGFRTIEFDLSSFIERSKYLLSILLPMTMVIITVMGGLYPAIEVVVSERERATIETILSSPIRGWELVAGKFLAVVAMSMLASLLNLFSILITAKHTLSFMTEMSEINISIPLSTIPLIILGSFLVAAMFSAIMITVAAFAKTFKEGQSFITPIYAIGIQPAVVSALPGIPFNETTALIPITNVSLMFRELIRGNMDIVPVAVTLGSLLIFCIVLLFIARCFINRESYVLGLSWKKVKRQFSLKAIIRRS